MSVCTIEVSPTDKGLLMDGNWQEIVSAVVAVVLGAVAKHYHGVSATRKRRISKLEVSADAATDANSDRLEERMSLARIEEIVVKTHGEVTGMRMQLTDHDRRIVALEKAHGNGSSGSPSPSFVHRPQ